MKSGTIKLVHSKHGEISQFRKYANVCERKRIVAMWTKSGHLIKGVLQICPDTDDDKVDEKGINIKSKFDLT